MMVWFCFQQLGLAIPLIVVSIYGSGASVALYAGPIMGVVMTIATVGLMSGIYLLLGGYNPNTSCVRAV